MKLKDELLKITDCFERNQIDYALCGGLALSVHGYPRFTRDIDLLIRDEDLERARTSLSKIGYDLEAGIFRFQVGTSQETHLFRVSRADGAELVTLDLLLVTPILEEVWSDREVIDLEGQSLRLVSRAGLIKMKQLAGRPQDLADIEALNRLENP
jgi:hypothetical protein